MSVAEFKAWLEGFMYNMDGPPNEEQWKAILEKINMVSGYVPPSQPYQPWIQYNNSDTIISNANTHFPVMGKIS